MIGATTTPLASLRGGSEARAQHFSPNVLLRPIVQDTLFPTICYVAGPSELAYLGQLGGVYEHFGLPMPLMYPRATATLIDSAAARFLTSTPCRLEDLQPQDESALNRLLKSQLPSAGRTGDARSDETVRRSMTARGGGDAGARPDARRRRQDDARPDGARSQGAAHQGDPGRQDAATTRCAASSPARSHRSSRRPSAGAHARPSCTSSTATAPHSSTARSKNCRWISDSIGLSRSKERDGKWAMGTQAGSSTIGISRLMSWASESPWPIALGPLPAIRCLKS